MELQSRIIRGVLRTPVDESYRVSINHSPSVSTHIYTPEIIYYTRSLGRVSLVDSPISHPGHLAVSDLFIFDRHLSSVIIASKLTEALDNCTFALQATAKFVPIASLVYQSKKN